MIKIIKNNDVAYYDDNSYRIGSGFINNLGAIALEKCPKCVKENYALMVMHGICAWCGFDANAKGEVLSEN